MSFIAGLWELSVTHTLGTVRGSHAAVVAIAATTVLTAWLSPAAEGASVSANFFSDSGGLNGEVNTVTVVRIADTYQITDTAATITASDPCSVDATGQFATCPVPADEGTLFAFLLGGQDDTISNQAADGRVSISGDAGNDTLIGGAATDYISGGDGNDGISGGGGGDDVFGGGGYDDVDGGDGEDTVRGGPNDDLLDGGAGGDFLDGDTGDDDLFGGPGDDTAHYGFRFYPVEVTLDDEANDGEESEFDYVASDVENLTGGDDGDLLIGNDADNILAGREGDDLIAGAGGGDALDGEAGNDSLDGGPGPDRLSGREGNDEIAARDGQIDSVRCGVGTDSVVADYNDSVNADCEAVDRSAAPPPPPPPPPPAVPLAAPPPADITPPALALSGAGAQKVLRQRGVFVVATPAEACTLTAKGTVSVPRVAKVFRFPPVTKQVAKGRTATLKLKLTRSALRAIGRALKAGQKLSAKVTVTAKDAAGNLTTKRRTVKFKR